MICQSFETENGFLGIVLGKDDSAELEVNYKGTIAMAISIMISVTSSIILVIYVCKKH